jgi:thioredoxin-dependent peroxiredoxin
MSKLVVLSFFVMFSSCETMNPIKVSHETVEPGKSVSFMGQTVSLDGTPIKVGDSFPPALMTDSIGKETAIKPDGRVKVIAIVPSIDTPVCDVQAHILSETEVLGANIDRITISRDLPPTQVRFAKKEGLTNVKFLSDYRGARFGNATGLLLSSNGLLTRSMMVVDGKGIIRYIQVVPELEKVPDMERAFAKAIAIEKGK